MDENILEQLVQGSIVGLLIGDALGYPYIDRKVNPAKIEMTQGLNGEAPGTYQSPGALTLCTLASINEFNEINLQNIIEKFHDFIVSGYLGATEETSIISETTIQSVKRHIDGFPPDKCGIKEDGINDGECLTRILPVALYCSNSLDNLVNQAHSVCKITHAQIKSQVACALYCLIIRNLLLQKSEKIFDLLMDYYRTKKMTEYVKRLEHMQQWKNANGSQNDNSVECCFWNAWSAYSQFENDYESCVKYAISLGGYTNYTGAIAGSIAALSNGLYDIPQKWLNDIVLSSESMEIITIFVDKIVKRLKN